ncbi:RluA family pseudouridine synthase [Candidatus Bipolaricaulota bacterium]|nr:RluA family pseudouridine synthase [Candidatus Bipolaricaulota bacterium]
MAANRERQVFRVEEAETDLRLDQVVARRLGLPRTVVRGLFEAGRVKVDGRPARPAARARPGQRVEVEPAPEAPPPPQVPILYEDEEVVVIDKPAGLPVHAPGIGRQVPTVVAALAQGRRLAGGEPVRPGVVHRLDAGTSGAMVLAKSQAAYQALVDQFRRRQVKKEYLALVEGEVEPDRGEIRGRLGRHPRAPWRMRVSREGKDARTEFTVLVRREGRSLLLVLPHTGRTHQIRVHLAAIGHPVVGDPIYGKPGERLLLHSFRLGFRHPGTGEWMEFKAPPPPELASWFAAAGNKGRPGNSPPPPPKTDPAPRG